MEVVLNSMDKNDQAATLRRMAGKNGGGLDSKRKKTKAARVISVTSGKGGVGKTTVVSNLAYLFCKLGKKVYVLDADMGLANIDVMLGLAPEYNMEHVLSGEKTVKDVIVDGPGGMKIIPASSGVQELADLTHEQKLNLLSEFYVTPNIIYLYQIRYYVLQLF